ncbi:hypothetical protein ACIQC5_18240 [Paenarthrobacter sp. NPDC092416]|uniref:hypothetical protein n=1 Tax=Paenarthrobacter sp. NPDC092416 TaxID=3364386 RepID=UPI00382C1C6C
MKLFGTPQSRGFALLAASVAVAVSACTPTPSGSSTPSAGDTSAASSSTASGTASAQPSNGASSATSPVPGATATVGALVQGFPEQLIPVMPKTSVRSSSFDKNVSPATVALVGTIKAPPEGVVDYYKASLEAQGFKVVPGPEAVGNITSIDFIRGDGETVNLSVRQKEGVSTFTIGANVAAGSVK